MQAYQKGLRPIMHPQKRKTGSDGSRERPCADARYISAKSLAQHLDCSETTVHAYVRRGILPQPVRIGELVRWRLRDIDNHIEGLTGGRDWAVPDDPYTEGL
jgi:predicted DNA-binding transcriptional regulator AlpA